jgi:uncharacterized protein (DUF1800 family)
MAPNPTLKPLPAASFGYEQARHLLNRAGFGGTPQQVEALRGMGLDRAVDHLVDYDKVPLGDLPEPTVDPDHIRPPNEAERAAYAEARRAGDEERLEQLRAKVLEMQGMDRRQMREVAKWWLARMIQTPRPLEEKLTLLWHGHFASNFRSVRDSYLLWQQNRLFRQHAAGNFANLAMGIIRDPAMIKFLNNDQNRRSAPNENLARELMELFTLGEGQYTEADIKEGARALTGYTFSDNDFSFRDRSHDPGAKTILGTRGNHNGEAFVQILLTRPSCPQFVAYKLYRHFVADLTSPRDTTGTQRGFVNNLARTLASSNYELRPALKAMFKSEHFYHESLLSNQIKSPTQLVVGTVRMLNTPVRDLDQLHDAMGRMGQRLFDPPSVAGWDGGRTWINTSTLFVRQNTSAFLLTGKSTRDTRWNRDALNYDPMFLVADLASPGVEAAVDRLLGTLIGQHAPSQRRDMMIRFLHDRGGAVTADTILALLLLMTSMPEYQLC